MAEKDITASQLALKLRVSRNAIYRAVEAGRITPTRRDPMLFSPRTRLPRAQRPRLNKRQRDDVLRLLDEGYSLREVAAEVGCSTSSAGRILQESRPSGCHLQTSD